VAAGGLHPRLRPTVCPATSARPTSIVTAPLESRVLLPPSISVNPLAILSQSLSVRFYDARAIILITSDIRSLFVLSLRLPRLFRSRLPITLYLGFAFQAVKPLYLGI
jgi:hypothetical protein